MGGLIAPAQGLEAVNSQKWGGASNDIVQSPALVYSTASVSPNYVSTGQGASLAPSTTRILLVGAFRAYNTTVGDGVILLIYRSTVGIPAAGNAPGGGDTLVWDGVHTQEGLASNPQSFGAHLLDTGLTAGTNYYYYMAMAALTGGTAEFASGTNVSLFTIESR
jgi:hypothetical protein